MDTYRSPFLIGSTSTFIFFHPYVVEKFSIRLEFCEMSWTTSWFDGKYLHIDRKDEIKLSCLRIYY